MRIVSVITAGVIAAAAFAAPAYAVTEVANGTLSTVGLYVPTVTLGSTGSFTATNGTTFITNGSGGFSGLSFSSAITNGTLSFSSTANTIVDQTVANFLTFSGYSFSVDSVQTISYASSAASKVVSLYLLGTTTGAGFDPTATSLTFTFNSTSGSAYSTAATLAVPPAGIGSVPEAATWGMMVIGFGAMGATMRRKRTSITFA